jgi:hypothetical protein
MAVLHCTLDIRLRVGLPAFWRTVILHQGLGRLRADAGGPLVYRGRRDLGGRPPGRTDGDGTGTTSIVPQGYDSVASMLALLDSHCGMGGAVGAAVRGRNKMCFEDGCLLRSLGHAAGGCLGKRDVFPSSLTGLRSLQKLGRKTV